MQDNINENENPIGGSQQGSNPYDNNVNSQGGGANPYGYNGGPQETDPYGYNSGHQGGAGNYDGSGYNNYGGNNNGGNAYGGPQGADPYEYNRNPQGGGNNGSGPYGGAPYGGNPYNHPNMNGNNPYGGYYHPNNMPQYGKGGAWTGGSPLVNAIQQAGRSMPFLIGTIGYTVYLILTLLSLFIPQYTYTLYSDVLGGVGTSIGAFIGMIPTAIVVIGMWMFYLSCARDEVPSTAGITLNRGAIITFIVLMGIITGIFLIAALILLGTGGYSQMYGHSHMASGIFSWAMSVIVVVFIFILAFCILGIIYYVKLLKTTKILRNTINTGRYCGKLPMYPLIINFLLAALNLFSLFSAVTGASIFYKIVTLVAALALVASLIATTVSLIMLRTQLESMR